MFGLRFSRKLPPEAKSSTCKPTDSKSSLRVARRDASLSITKTHDPLLEFFGPAHAYATPLERPPENRPWLQGFDEATEGSQYKRAGYKPNRFHSRATMGRASLVPYLPYFSEVRHHPLKSPRQPNFDWR